MKVDYEECVFEELVNLSEPLADIDEALAHRFLDACNQAFEFLSENPYLGSPGKFDNPELAEVQLWRIKSFEKYLVSYLPAAESITIVHVLHSATDYNRAFPTKN